MEMARCMGGMTSTNLIIHCEGNNCVREKERKNVFMPWLMS